MEVLGSTPAEAVVVLLSAAKGDRTPVVVVFHSPILPVLSD